MEKLFEENASQDWKEQQLRQAMLSNLSFMEKLFDENASQDWWGVFLGKFKSLSAGVDWIVKTNADAVAAIIAIETKQPDTIKIICDDEGKINLSPSLVSAIFAKAVKKTKFNLKCLDSLFGGENKSQNSKELLTICLESQK